MKKKYIIIILLIIGIYSILLINGDTTEIGHDSVSTVTIPKGFSVNETSENMVILSNDDSKYTIKEIQNKTIESIFEEYNIKHENHTVSVSSSDVNGIELLELNLRKNGRFVHSNYFYEKNGLVYQIYPEGNYDYDIIKQIVNSTNKKIF